MSVLSVFHNLFGINLTNNIYKNKSDPNSLENRMRSIVFGYNQNDKRCHNYKPHIVSMKSRSLLDYINRITSVDEKFELLQMIDDILVNVCKELYIKFDPSMIYSFGNEINLVFYYNDKGEFLYGGNVNKILSTIISYTSIKIAREFAKRNIYEEFIFDGHFVEFDQDFETLNYLIWRQFDCKRNTLSLLYKCLHMESVLDGNYNINNIKMNDMKTEIEDTIFGKSVDERKNYNKRPLYFNLLTGNIFKKRKFYKKNQSEFHKKSQNEEQNEKQNKEVVRKYVGVENFYMKYSFKAIFETYIKKKVI